MYVDQIWLMRSIFSLLLKWKKPCLSENDVINTFEIWRYVLAKQLSVALAGVSVRLKGRSLLTSLKASRQA